MANILNFFKKFNIFRVSSQTITSKYLTECNLTMVVPSSWFRFKHTQYTGVKGLRNRKFQNSEPSSIQNNNKSEFSDELDLDDKEYDDLVSSTMNVTREVLIEQRVFVIQPYVKWGPKKSSTTPDLQLQEAEALIRSLPQWSVELSIKIPLESLEKKALFGTGKMKELKEMINKYQSHGKLISCIFISKGTLSFAQKLFLQNEFNGIPIMDRYSIVIQILRLHAITAEAKLQVALAEIPYIWNQMKDSNPSLSRRQGFSITDSQRELLNKREKKLKQAIEKIRNHRKLLRNKRRKEDYPIIAVVGYTNAGKTSLIKALTDEETIRPRDQLFATLDVTAHAGILPCKLQVIYMDTVGFISDIPTGLIECFIATLEDALLSDIIIHVQDLSHQNHEEQCRHVEDTLKSLSCFTKENEGSSDIDESENIPSVINVGNKVDLIDVSSLSSIIEKYQNMKLVSSKTLAGINDLMLEIESKILKATNRIKLTMRVSNGGEEMAWLYKNAAITSSRADPGNEQNILLDVVIHNSKLQIFKHHFVGGKR